MAKTRISLLLAGSICCAAANAIEWEFEPSIDIAESYTSNLRLDPDGMETDEFVTEVEPALVVSAIGKQFEIDFEYRLQGLFYSRMDELDEVLNYSRTNGVATLIDDTLFVNFGGSLSQQIVNPEGRIGISTISDTGNRQEVGNFSVRPFFQKKLSNTTSATFGYSYGLVEYQDVSQPDSQSSGFFGSISGKPPQSAWSWKLDGNDSTIDYDTGAQVKLRRIGVEIAWSPGGKSAIFVGGGDEDNSFSQLVGTPKIDGAFWNVGIRGKLDKLTEYSVSAGRQHFGDSYEFSLKRRASQLTTDISYLEETTTVGQQQAGYEALFDFLSDVSGVELPSAGVEVYVRKRVSAVATLDLARSSFRLNAYDEKRDYLTPLFGNSDGVTGTALSWTWTGRPRSQFSVDIGWQRFDLRGSLNTPEDIRLQLRFNRDLGNGFSVNLRAWSNNRAGTTANEEYTENAISIGLGKSF